MIEPRAHVERDMKIGMVGMESAEERGCHNAITDPRWHDDEQAIEIVEMVGFGTHDCDDIRMIVVRGVFALE